MSKNLLPVVCRTLLMFIVMIMPAVSTVLAQNNIDKKVDRIINTAMATEGFPGVAVAIIQDGKTVLEKGYGVRSVNDPVKPDENTIFSIGSVSKAFTAVGVMLLVQDNKIALDDPIKKYMKNMPAAWQDITIRQFMTHTSGIPELKGDKDKGSFEETLAAAGGRPLSFNPGKKQQYNNFNFAVMGKLIEQVSGKDYMTFMQTRVFRPLGLTRTGVKPASDNLSTGHMDRNGKLQPIVTHFNTGDYGVPSGGLQTTLADFASLSKGLSQASLLRKKTINAMWTPYSARLSNTPGWHSRMAGNDIIIHKGGGGTGIGSVCDVKIIPSRNIFVVVMINKAKSKISPSDLTDDILSQIYNIPKSTAADNAGEGDGN